MEEQIKKSAKETAESNAQSVVGWQRSTETEQVKVTAPSAVNGEVGYVIKDPYFGKFEVKKTYSGWWKDSVKVNKMIDAFKMGHIIKDVLFYTGISWQQWETFNEVHPEFYLIKEACGEIQMFKAMNTINANLDDVATARWFLDRRHPKFATKVRAEPEEPLQPTINQNINIRNIDNAYTREITTALIEIAREVFGVSEEDARAISDEIMDGMIENEEKV